MYHQEGLAVVALVEDMYHLATVTILVNLTAKMELPTQVREEALLLQLAVDLVANGMAGYRVGAVLELLYLDTQQLMLLVIQLQA
tara:strand:+ start:570 stop:824 length:255 start_codon:yes stop_codon:yes gene_type:complete